MIYVTYYQNGVMRRAVLSERQYTAYQKDISIKGLQVHGNQRLMETYFNETNGITKNQRQLLHG